MSYIQAKFFRKKYPLDELRILRRIVSYKHLSLSPCSRMNIFLRVSRKYLIYIKSFDSITWILHDFSVIISLAI